MDQDKTRWRQGFYNASWWVFLANLFILPFQMHSWINTFLTIWLSLFLIVRIYFREFRGNRGLWALLAFVIVVFASCFSSLNLDRSMTYFVKDMLQAVVLYLVASQMLTNRERFPHFSVLLLSSFILATVMSLGHYGHKGALYGIFGLHTRYGKFLDLAIPMALSLVVGDAQVVRVLGLAFLILGGYSLILTLSRGAWVGCGVGVVGVILRLRRALIALLILAPVLSLALLVIPNKSNIHARFLSLLHIEQSVKKEKSLTHRRDFYKTALVLIKERPILGWGYGRKTPELIVKKKGPEWFASRGLRPFYHHAHNTYLEILLETGILGLLAFLALLVACFFNYWRVRPDHMEVFSLKTGAFFSILALLVHGLVTNFFQQPFIPLLFIYMALLNTEVEDSIPS